MLTKTWNCMGCPAMTRRGSVAAWAMLLLAVCGFGGCVRKPEVRLADIEVEALTLRSLDLVCLFEVRNPNWFDARPISLDWRMCVGDEVFATGAASQPIPIVPALGKAIVPVAAKIDLGRLGRLVRKYRKGEDLIYRLEGRPVFSVLGISVPVSVEHLGLTPRIQAPRWRLRRVSLAKSLKPELLLTFEITNPGELALALKEMDGSLNLAGEPVLQVRSVTLTELPGCGTAELVVPVRVRPGGVLKAILKAVADPETLSFEGDFHLRTPLSIRRAMLGRKE